MLMCALLHVPMLKTNVVYSRKKLKDCTMFKVPGVIQAVITIMVLLMEP